MFENTRNIQEFWIKFKLNLQYGVNQKCDFKFENIQSKSIYAKLKSSNAYKENQK